MKAIVVTGPAAGQAGMRLGSAIGTGRAAYRQKALDFGAHECGSSGRVEARLADGRAIDFVVESSRSQLGELVQRVRDGRLRTNIGTIATLDDALAALNPTERRAAKTVIRVRP